MISNNNGFDRLCVFVISQTLIHLSQKQTVSNKKPDGIEILCAVFKSPLIDKNGNVIDIWGISKKNMYKF